MKRIDFKPEHLDLVEELNIEEHEVTKDMLVSLYKDKTPADFMFTFIDDGRIVSISGFKYIWESVAECYNVRLKHLNASHLRHIKKTIDEHMVYFDRVQTHSKAGKWSKWHRLLGFEKEATLRKYKDGKDYELWSILSERV